MPNNVVEILLRLRDSASQGLSNFNKSLSLTKEKILGFGVGALTVGVALNKIVHEMKDADDANARLAAAFKTNAGFVGLTKEALGGYAEALQRTTTFSDESIKRGEALLLQFRNIRGEVFQLANQAMVDLAAKMGGDVPGAAQLLGRALQDPIRGMQQLRRAGIILVESQKEQIKNFIALGDVQSAQKVILEQVEKQAGGTAEALRHTLGGSVTALHNAFNDLFEGTPEQVSKTTESILKIADALEDPAFKAAVQHQVGLIAELAAAWLEAGVASEKYADQALKATLSFKQRALSGTRQFLNDPLGLFGGPKIKINGQGLGDLANVGGLLGTDVPQRRFRPGPGFLHSEPRAAALPFDFTGDAEAKARAAKEKEAAEKSALDLIKRQAEFQVKLRTAQLDRLDVSIQQNFAEAEARDGVAKAADLAQKQLAAFKSGGQDALDVLNRQVEAQKLAAEFALQATTNVEDYKKAYAEVLPLIQETVDKQAELAKTQQFAADFKSAFVGAFQQINKGLGGMVQSFLQAFEQILAQRFAGKLAEQILGALGDLKSSKGGGGILGSLVSFIGSLFFAGGGTSPGGVATVGETGPETVFLPRGSRVQAGAGRRRAQDQGGTTVSVRQGDVFISGLGASVEQVQAMLLAAQRQQFRLTEQTFRDNGVELR